MVGWIIIVVCMLMSILCDIKARRLKAEDVESPAFGLSLVFCVLGLIFAFAAAWVLIQRSKGV